VCCSGLNVQLFSIEMGLEKLLDRLIANVGSINLSSFREGMNLSEAERVKSAINRMRGKNLDIHDASRVTVGDVRRRTRIAQLGESKVGLVIVDYLQLVTSAAHDQYSRSREREVAEMSRGFKLLAKSLDVPVLLLAQLNRQSEAANREPRLYDLRESGAIEADADAVIFLHPARKETWKSDEPVKVIVAKGRNSGVGVTTLNFRRNIQRFEEGSEQEFAEAAREEKRHYAQDLD
jgi:replicative DNA helicase